MKVLQYILIYLGILNLTGFVLMGIDKLKAKMHSFRIPEAALFLVAAFGGSIGSLLGMAVFRHKTKHLSFLIGMPVILVIQIALVIVLYFSMDIVLFE